ncbi:helix-turn-helix domain-containing protein [Afifella sp. H1R]|uniref:helix-turn-helix domain-containing protein n=1 Tax=Afifella sp. H1R TaxID=2908841 RepID=UPI001F4324B6|nr:helix-turn-helix domain-containing protein [Afifella sp. H1R]MCF1502887.1 helix-turn-helix domain-containing protein [Afifella sp. H1R]
MNGEPLNAFDMENHPWQQRARAAGLTQRTLAKLLGRPEITVSRQLRGHWESGVPFHVVSAILAWEVMSPDARQAWVEAVEKAKAEEGGEG